jgi:hypothetical protein
LAGRFFHLACGELTFRLCSRSQAFMLSGAPTS